MIVRQAATHRDFGSAPWLEFATLTRVPICTKLVDFSLLHDHEKNGLQTITRHAIRTSCHWLGATTARRNGSGVSKHRLLQLEFVLFLVHIGNPFHC